MYRSIQTVLNKSADYEHINLQHREEVLHINIAWLYLWIREFKSIRIVGGITTYQYFLKEYFVSLLKRVFDTRGKRAQNLFQNQMGKSGFYI